jgi:hypothetical protein
MGNVNVSQTARERLKEMALDDDRKESEMATHLINKEWRGRKGYKTETEVNKCNTL